MDLSFDKRPRKKTATNYAEEIRQAAGILRAGEDRQREKDYLAGWVDAARYMQGLFAHKPELDKCFYEATQYAAMKVREL